MNKKKLLKNQINREKKNCNVQVQCEPKRTKKKKNTKCGQQCCKISAMIACNLKHSKRLTNHNVGKKKNLFIYLVMENLKL